MPFSISEGETRPVAKVQEKQRVGQKIVSKISALANGGVRATTEGAW